jgi:cell division protein FtsQ
MKKVIIILIWLIVVVGLIFLVSLIRSEHKNVRCNRIDIMIMNSGYNDFVTKADIIQIMKQYDNSIIGKNITELNNEKIVKKILENPFIKKADVYTTNDGCLKININQRKPVIRVINSKGDSYYIDEDGGMMPLSSKYTPRIIIAHGNINNDYSANFKLINYNKKIKLDTNKLTDLQKLYFVCKYINNSDFRKALVDNIYVEPNGDLSLYLCIGNQRVVIGSVDNLNEKFSKLEEFYRQKMSKLGWGKYNTINLKYKNQIVCSKNL